MSLLLAWPNGHGVALLRQRLRVRVPPQSLLTVRAQASSTRHAKPSPMATRSCGEPRESSPLPGRALVFDHGAMHGGAHLKQGAKPPHPRGSPSV